MFGSKMLYLKISFVSSGLEHTRRNQEHSDGFGVLRVVWMPRNFLSLDIPGVELLRYFSHSFGIITEHGFLTPFLMASSLPHSSPGAFHPDDSTSYRGC